MRSSRATARAYGTDPFATTNELTDFNVDSADMKIFGEKSLAVINHDHRALEIEIAICERDHSVGGRNDRRSGRRSKIDAVMRSLLDSIEYALCSKGTRLAAIDRPDKPLSISRESSPRRIALPFAIRRVLDSAERLL